MNDSLKVNNLTTIVLACGDSKRFSYYGMPKQFLRFAMYPLPEAQMWENTMVGMSTPTDVVVAFRFDHREFVEPPQLLHHVNAVWLDRTRGQAHTLLQALDQTNLYGREVVVLNCDQGFAPGVIDSMIEAGRACRGPAAVTFGAGPQEAKRWSYVDDHPVFYSAAEKQAISDHALAGAYYFPDRIPLYRALTRAIANANFYEPYISHVYAQMTGSKLSVEISRNQWYDWGTHEAFERFRRRDEHPQSS